MNVKFTDTLYLNENINCKVQANIQLVVVFNELKVNSKSILLTSL